MYKNWKRYINLKGLLRISQFGLFFLRMKYFSFFESRKLRLLGVHVGKKSRIFGRIDLNIHPLSKVSISDNVRINSGFTFKPCWWLAKDRNMGR